MSSYVREVELRRALIDPRSLLNIMPLSTLEVVEITRDRIIEQLIKLLGSIDSASSTLSYMNLDLTIKPTLAATGFHSLTPEPLIIACLKTVDQQAQSYSSTYHQCLKAIRKVKKVQVNAFGCPF